VLAAHPPVYSGDGTNWLKVHQVEHVEAELPHAEAEAE